MENINRTTSLIKDTLGATYTTKEVRNFLSEVEAKLSKQAPYFDGRVLDQQARLEKALGLPKSTR